MQNPMIYIIENNTHKYYLDEHVGKGSNVHVDVGLWISKLTRSLHIEGAAGCKGEREGADDDAHHLGHCWSAC